MSKLYICTPEIKKGMFIKIPAHKICVLLPFNESIVTIEKLKFLKGAEFGECEKLASQRASK